MRLFHVPEELITKCTLSFEGESGGQGYIAACFANQMCTKIEGPDRWQFKEKHKYIT